jgi:hypothetical protein
MTYLPPLLRKMKAKQYAVFEGARFDYDLNIIGVRNAVSRRKPDLYLDDLYVYWKQAGSWRCFNAALTTTPGEYYLVHPMRPESGCAIMAPGQYRKAYIKGLHRGTPGLLQRGAKVSWYRDNDRDKVLDLDPSTIASGYAGLNIHRGGRSDRVGKWSAGCQVMHPSDMDTLMELAEKQAAHGPGWDRYTYTLIDEEEI